MANKQQGFFSPQTLEKNIGWMIIASVLGIGLGVTSLVVGGKRLARSWPWRRIR